MAARTNNGGGPKIAVNNIKWQTSTINRIIKREFNTLSKYTRFTQWFVYCAIINKRRQFQRM